MNTPYRPTRAGGRTPDRIRINEQIRAAEVRLIDQDGEQQGIVSPRDALKLAEAAELDLVEIAPTARPPVCRIMDYSKFKYDQAKKEKEARKKQKVIHVKEIKLHPRTGQHDYEFKKKHLEKFLKSGDRAKVTMVFRGRENAKKEDGRKVLDQLASELSAIAEVESDPKVERNQMFMILIPRT